jgi:tetratricopeptide (TPR) repeat protein
MSKAKDLREGRCQRNPDRGEPLSGFISQYDPKSVKPVSRIPSILAGGAKMATWVFLFVFILTFLNPSEKAFGQIYWKAKKDGSYSFSDNPTSSILKDEPDETSLPWKETSEDVMRLSLPEKNWALEFPFKDFRVKERGILPAFNGRRILAQNDKTNVILSVFLNPAQRQVTNKDLREYAWKGLKKLPIRIEEVKRSEEGPWSFLEYMVKDAKDYKGLRQKNIFAYLVKGDTWVDYHLSKVRYEPEDEGLFRSFIQSVKVLENFLPSGMDNFQYGSFFYLKKNYGRAIVYYERALDQEKRNPTLHKNSGRVLIDNLGMAYGMTGNLEKSRKTLEYGISNDPTFPMYYYSLACTYAELNDPKQAIQNLKTAGEYKNNMIAGEQRPDPLKHPSFRY